MKICFLFGHRDCPEDRMPDLENAIEKHYIEYGVRSYYVGNRGNFDRLAAAAVNRVKLRYPEIMLYLVLAYHPGDRARNLPEGFDGTYYPPMETVPRPYAIVRANRYMVENSDYVICYVHHPGNTRNLLEYALKKNVSIENIPDAFP